MDDHPLSQSMTEDILKHTDGNQEAYDRIMMDMYQTKINEQDKKLKELSDMFPLSANVGLIETLLKENEYDVEKVIPLALAYEESANKKKEAKIITAKPVTPVVKAPLKKKDHFKKNIDDNTIKQLSDMFVDIDGALVASLLEKNQRDVEATTLELLDIYAKKDSEKSEQEKAEQKELAEIARIAQRLDKEEREKQQQAKSSINEEKKKKLENDVVEIATIVKTLNREDQDNKSAQHINEEEIQLSSEVKSERPFETVDEVKKEENIIPPPFDKDECEDGFELVEAAPETKNLKIELDATLDWKSTDNMIVNVDWKYSSQLQDDSDWVGMFESKLEDDPIFPNQDECLTWQYSSKGKTMQTKPDHRVLTFNVPSSFLFGHVLFCYFTKKEGKYYCAAITPRIRVGPVFEISCKNEHLNGIRSVLVDAVQISRFPCPNAWIGLYRNEDDANEKYRAFQYIKSINNNNEEGGCKNMRFEVATDGEWFVRLFPFKSYSSLVKASTLFQSDKH